MYKKTVDLFFLNIYSSYFRSAIIQSESEATKEGRRAWYSRGAQGEGSRGGRSKETGEQHREETDRQPDCQNNVQPDEQGGQAEQSEEVVNADSQESSGVEKEAQYEREMRRQKLRERKRKRFDRDDSDGDDSDDYVEARVPRNLLKKLSLLSVSLGLSVRQQLSMTMATYELVGE